MTLELARKVEILRSFHKIIYQRGWNFNESESLSVDLGSTWEGGTRGCVEQSVPRGREVREAVC